MISPVLYSFRRCPYAIRARMALAVAGFTVELREVILKDKPKEMLAASTKGTVPVLVLEDGGVIDESLDIMRWALQKSDPQHWLSAEGEDLIAICDGEFKVSLDRYKYADRYPERSVEVYRQRCEAFIAELEQRLSEHAYLMADRVTLADIAIFPFIRQFAAVDSTWFAQSSYPKTNHWLQGLCDAALFLSVMNKAPSLAGR